MLPYSAPCHRLTALPQRETLLALLQLPARSRMEVEDLEDDFFSFEPAKPAPSGGGTAAGFSNPAPAPARAGRRASPPASGDPVPEQRTVVHSGFDGSGGGLGAGGSVSVAGPAAGLDIGVSGGNGGGGSEEVGYVPNVGRSGRVGRMKSLLQLQNQEKQGEVPGAQAPVAAGRHQMPAAPPVVEQPPTQQQSEEHAPQLGAGEYLPSMGRRGRANMQGGMLGLSQDTVGGAEAGGGLAGGGGMDRHNDVGGAAGLQAVQQQPQGHAVSLNGYGGEGGLAQAGASVSPSKLGGAGGGGAGGGFKFKFGGKKTSSVRNSAEGAAVAAREVGASSLAAPATQGSPAKPQGGAVWSSPEAAQAAATRSAQHGATDVGGGGAESRAQRGGAAEASRQSYDSISSVQAGGGKALGRRGGGMAGGPRKSEKLRRLEEELAGMGVTGQLDQAYLDGNGLNRRPREPRGRRGSGGERAGSRLDNLRMDGDGEAARSELLKAYKQADASRKENERLLSPARAHLGAYAMPPAKTSDGPLYLCWCRLQSVCV